MSELADGQAFPHFVEFHHEDHTSDVKPQPGMTYRQWLIGQALQGVLSNPAYLEIEFVHKMVRDYGDNYLDKIAIIHADQVIRLQE